MWVRIGPVAAVSARAWLGSARHNLQLLQDDERVRGEVGLPADVLSSFTRFLTEWSAAAGNGDFDWAAEVEPRDIRPLAAWWFNLAQVVRERGPELGLVAAPLQAEEFYDALVGALAEVLAAAEDTDRFADKFAEVVPEFGDQQPPPREAGTPISVLVVDDTEDIRLLLRFALDHDIRFAVVGEAGTGEDAVDFCERQCPDVVLLDCMLPGISGLDALPLIRDRCPHTRVVMCSASDEFRDPAERWGVPFLPKTASMAEIANTLVAIAA